MIVRTVVDTLPEFPNEEVTFYRRGGTFTDDEAYPPRLQSTMTDDVGAYSIDLWPNAEGLTETSYLAVYPGKDTFTFVLEPGDDPITASELRAQDAWNWHTSPVPTAIDIERARYANTSNPVLGDALIGTRAIATGATARTVHDKLGEVLSVKDFGAVGDGTTPDDTAFTVAMIAAQESNRPLFIPAGTYNLTDLQVMTQTAPLIMYGESKETTILIGANELDETGKGKTLIRPQMNFSLHDVTLDGFYYGLYTGAFAAPFDFYTVENVEIRNGSYGLYSGLSVVFTYDPTIICDRLTIRDNYIHDCSVGGGIIWQAPVNSAKVIGNRIKRCHSRGIQIGRNFATVGVNTQSLVEVLAGQDAFRSMAIINNTVEEMLNVGNGTIHNIICYGKEIVVIGNIVAECNSTATTKEIGGIYTKSRRAIVTGNIVRDLYHSGGGTFTAALTGGLVTGVTVVDGGSYTSQPTVRFSGGGGYGASGYATLAPTAPASITSITVQGHGRNYTTSPTVTITGGGGSGATATTIPEGGGIYTITVTNGGSGYTSAPVVTISGGGGTGATATAGFNFASVITSITVTNGGSGYIVAPTVSMVGGGPTGGEYYINIKGSPRQSTPISVQGYSTTVKGNQVFCNGVGKTGIRIQNESTNVEGNTVEGPTVGAIVVSSGAGDDDPDELGSEGYDDIQIVNNQLTGTQLAGTYGINCTTIGDRVKIAGNLVRDFAGGIRITGGSGTPYDHTIENNQVYRTTTQGIEMNHTAAIYNLRILNNTVRGVNPLTGNGQGILVNVSAPAHNLEIRGNGVRDINPKVGTATGIYLLPTAPVYNVTIEDNAVDCINTPVPAFMRAIVGPVTSIAVDNGGSGYNTAPTISFTGGGGSGATATATVLAGAVTAITVTAGGTLYTSAPTVVITPTDGGTSAAATASVAAGQVTGVTLVSGGSSFTSVPTIVFTPANGATALATVATGAVTAIAVTAGGSGYTAAPLVVLTGGGGTGATATATVSNGAVTAVTVGAGGSGYATAPTVSFAAGSGAAATATIFPVAAITLTNGGSGYTTAPTVSITGGSGSGATATATVSDGTVTAVTIDTGANGSGYTTAPDVSFSGGGGTGAEATATPSTGIAAITITNAGSGYTSAPLMSTTGGNTGNASSGYGVRIAGTPISTAWIETSKSTNIKTTILQLDTPPLNRKGTIVTTFSFNPPSCANAATAVIPNPTTGLNYWTLVGASLRDEVGVEFMETTQPGVMLPGITVEGYVSAADQVTLYVQNLSGSTINLNAGTATVTLKKP